jgi:hypothetical protein
MALALAAFAAGVCSAAAHTGAQGPRTLLRLASTPTAFGLNGSRLAWIGDRVVLDDLGSGNRIALTRGRTDYEEPVAVAGSTVVWLEAVGGNSIVDTLRAAAPGHSTRFGQWGDDDYFLESGPLLGGIAADGKRLVYGLYRLTSVERNSDRCYSQGICHWNVTGGGTFIVEPGSLSRRRILPPATAVSVDGNTIVAATLEPGTRYENKAQIVLLNLSDGSRSSLGKPVDATQLILHGDRLAAVSVRRHGTPFVRVWNVRTRQLIRTLALPSSTKLKHFAWTGGRLILRASFDHRPAILALDLRTGRRTVVARIRGYWDYGPWAWRGRAVWIEQRHRGTEKATTLVWSAPVS